MPPRTILHLIVALLTRSVAAEAEVSTSRGLNRLAAEDSSYLRGQAAGAVQWHPWGPEAFAQAALIGRPVFLSIGGATCHWSSRMDRGAFRDPATVAMLNAGSINVKIDRFERPDLGRLFLRFVEATGQRARWPLNIWLGAERVPIRAVDSLEIERGEEGGFLSEARHFLTLWAEEGPRLQTQARFECKSLARRLGPDLAGSLEVNDAFINAARGRILGEFDPVAGGFGQLPKFPAPARLLLLARGAARSGVASERGRPAGDVIAATLDGMARSGLRDHLAGGFFRYALDESWRRPNFEKLALDQALAVESLLAGYQLTGHQRFADVARETLRYAIGELGHPEGAFYNGEHCESRPDENSEPEEGAYYTWSREEWRREAGMAADVMEMAFDIRPRGNLPVGFDAGSAVAGMNVPACLNPIPQVAGRLGLPVREITTAVDRGRASLLAARHRRPRPPLDRLLITQMNAALISALCHAGTQLNDPSYVDRARQAAAFIRSGLWDAGSATLFRCRLDRAPRHMAVAEDYAYLVRALLDLHAATGEICWLQWADEVQAVFDRHHADPAGGGYFDARHDSSDVPIALKTIDDAAAFSPNATAGLNLMRWSVLLQAPGRVKEARRLLDAFAVPLRSGSASLAGLFHVADTLVHPPGRIILLGRPQDAAALAARARILSQPDRWEVLSVEDAVAQDWLAQRQVLPSAAVRHPLDAPSFFVRDGDGMDQGPFSLRELHRFLDIER